jgi:hypothetical protein
MRQVAGPLQSVLANDAATGWLFRPASPRGNQAKETKMKMLTKANIEQLKNNGLKQAPVKGTPQEIDFYPVVKLFTPDAQATWLLTEIDPEDTDIAFGLCDLGMEFLELGYVSPSELASIRGRLGLPIERDLCFVAKKPLSEYASEANKNGGIIA